MALETLEIGLYSHRLTNSLLQQIELGLARLKSLHSEDFNLGLPIRALRRIHKRLQRPLRVCVLGELNSGKSSMCNMLLGSIRLPTRAISNTKFPTLIRYSASPALIAVLFSGKRVRITPEQIDQINDIYYLDVGLPIKHLRYLEIMDFPPLVTPEEAEYELDLPSHHIDAMIWCTTAIGAWKKSEQDIWDTLPRRLQERSLLVVTRKDQLDEENTQKVLMRLNYEVGESFSGIVMVSPTEALKAHDTVGESSDISWKKGGGLELENRLHNMLLSICNSRARSAMYTTKKIAGRILTSFDVYQSHILR